MWRLRLQGLLWWLRLSPGLLGRELPLSPLLLGLLRVSLLRIARLLRLPLLWLALLLPLLGVTLLRVTLPRRPRRLIRRLHRPRAYYGRPGTCGIFQPPGTWSVGGGA